MSDLIVDVCAVDAVKPHPNADKLDVAVIKGWQCVVARGSLKPGERVVYFPPDTVLPEFVSHALNVHRYLKGRGKARRIGQIRLRGEPSFGLAIPVKPEWEEEGRWAVGRSAIEFFAASKYEPPLLVDATEAVPEHPLLARYTEIQDLRNFPRAFEEGEEVSITEKIHGTNVRFGLIRGEWMAGSRLCQRARPANDALNFYWLPYTIEGVRELLESLGREHAAVILYGETYGKVQSLKYGLPNSIAFRAFDLSVDGKYLGVDEFQGACSRFRIPMVPLLSRVPFSLQAVKDHSEGKTTIDGAEHIREGVVVRPLVDRYSDYLRGRLILKYLGDSYLLSKAREEDTTDA